MSETTAPRAGASMPRENLIRAIHPGVELVRAEGDAMPTLTGHFAVVNQWTEINSVFEGHFMERFAPGAFAKTIRESRDQMKVLFQHGQDPVIGDKPLGPIRSLTEDATGARYEVPMLDTSYNRDLIPALEAGLYGASFRFKVMMDKKDNKPKPSRMNPDGIPERTVTEAQVREFGPVTFPAYSGATAGLRSMTDDFLFASFVDDPDKLLELLRAYKGRRDGEPKVTVVNFDQSLSGKPVRVAKYRRDYKTLPLAKNAEEARLDAEDLSTLACMLQSGAQYIAEQDEPADQANIPKMEAILASIAALVTVEAQETEPADDELLSEPEPSGATTRLEPEPSAATTRSHAGLFWFAPDPKLKGATT